MKPCLPILAFLMASVSLPASHVVGHDGEPTRTVSLSVTVLEPNGGAVSELGVHARAESADVRSSVGALLNELGQATLELRVPIDSQELHVVLGPRIEKQMSPGSMAKINQRFHELKRKYSIRRQYDVHLRDHQSDFSLEIHLNSAVVVRGRMITPDGNAVKGSLSARTCACYAWTNRDGTGEFELFGVPRGEPIDLVLSGNSELTRIMRLTEDQTLDDIELGDIVLDPIMGSSKARVLNAPAAQRAHGGSQLLTVISSDGNRVISVVADATNGQVQAPWLDTSQGWLAPGEYYVFPGSLHTDDHGWQLLDLIRTGKAKDHPELPSFVATPEKEVAITIDPTDMRRKIKAAAEAEGLSESP